MSTKNITELLYVGIASTRKCNELLSCTVQGQAIIIIMHLVEVFA